MITIGSNRTTPAVLTIPNSAMNAQHKWFTTTLDSDSAGSEIIGELRFATQTSSAEVIQFAMEIEYEFNSLQDPTTIGPVLREWMIRSVSGSSKTSFVQGGKTQGEKPLVRSTKSDPLRKTVELDGEVYEKIHVPTTCRCKIRTQVGLPVPCSAFVIRKALATKELEEE
jgi:hypothetical protein